jgi:L-rhamnose mutarotase
MLCDPVPVIENGEKIKVEEDKFSNKSDLSGPNPFDEAQKLFQATNTPTSKKGEEKLVLSKTPSEMKDLTNGNNLFLGRKTIKNNKENNHNSNNNEIFKISKQNSGISNNSFNIMNEEEDLQKYLECNEKNEEANKMSFDTNFLENENLFDFNNTNNNACNNVNMNNNVNLGSEKEFF